MLFVKGNDGKFVAVYNATYRVSHWTLENAGFGKRYDEMPQGGTLLVPSGKVQLYDRGRTQTAYVTQSAG